MVTKIAISHFKAHCLDIIDKLHTKGESIIITKRDKPVAKLQAIDSRFSSIFGMLQDKAQINGDLLDPINEEWEVNNE